MTEEQIKHMVSRFLCWKLPKNFSPDAGISFKAEYNENTRYPMLHKPTGTNLFDATQAEQMVRYMIEGMPDSERLTARLATLEAETIERCAKVADAVFEENVRRGRTASSSKIAAAIRSLSEPPRGEQR